MAVSEPAQPDPQTLGLSPAAAANFAQLRQRFVAGLAQRWLEIAAARTDSAQQHIALHRLAGAAGSYGLHALGAAARRAELSLEQGQDRELKQALAELEALISSASVTNP